MADVTPTGHPGGRRAVAAVIGGTFAIAVSVTTLVVSLWMGTGDRRPRAGCAEGRLVTAQTYGTDAGLALAVARSVTTTHPHLRGIVDAAAAHAARYPDVDGLTVDAGLPAGDASLTFVTALVDLADRPDLATPDVLTALQRAAASGGMVGLHSVIVDPDIHPPTPAGRDALDQLRAMVARQRAAVAGAGMVGLPSRSCLGI